MSTAFDKLYRYETDETGNVKLVQRDLAAEACAAAQAEAETRRIEAEFAAEARAPGQKYMQLFARDSDDPDWTVFGNEV